MAWIAGAGAIVGALISSDSGSDSAAAAQQASDLQFKIAQQIQDRANELFALWRNEYKLGELSLLHEVQQLQVYIPQYDTAAQRAITQVRKQFTRARRDALACVDVHCVGAFCGLTKDLALAEAMAGAWAANAMIRSEDEKKLLRDQHRREEQYRMATFGHQAFSSSNGLAAAAQIYSSVAQAARQAASANMAATGYFLQRALSNFGMQRPSGYATQAAAPIESRTSPGTFSTPASTSGGYNINPSDPYGVGADGMGGVAPQNDNGVVVTPIADPDVTSGGGVDYGEFL